MIEEGFVRMYAHDFAALAARAEGGSDVEALVRKRIEEARSHAALMDARKGEGHLPAVADAWRTRPVAKMCASSAPARTSPGRWPAAGPSCCRSLSCFARRRSPPAGCRSPSEGSATHSVLPDRRKSASKSASKFRLGSVAIHRTS